MRFEFIRAQDAAIGTLKRALTSGKVPHAYIFSGPAGVGKRLSAMALASSLNCTEEREDSCGACNSCRKIARGVHPDVFTLSLPEQRKSIPVDSVRELEGRLATRPHEGRAKVAIIDPADRMTESAANAILKTLEEPGAGRFLILVTARISSLLPTVRSRCQVVRFNSLPIPFIKQLLVEHGCSETQAATAAAFSSGSLDRAVAFAEGGLENRVKALLSFLESAVETTPLTGLEIIEELRRGGAKIRDEALALIDMAPPVLSELLARLTGAEDERDPLLLDAMMGGRIGQVANSLSIEHISQFAMSFHHAHQAILNNNMNPQLALEGVLMSTRSRLNHMTAGTGNHHR